MTPPATTTRRVLHYDRTSRRLWIYGQRCHHGATGAVLCVSAAVGLAVRLKASALAAAVLSGSALMLHDWHDRTIWFQRGWQD